MWGFIGPQSSNLLNKAHSESEYTDIQHWHLEAELQRYTAENHFLVRTEGANFASHKWATMMTLIQHRLTKVSFLRKISENIGEIVKNLHSNVLNVFIFLHIFIHAFEFILWLGCWFMVPFGGKQWDGVYVCMSVNYHLLGVVNNYVWRTYANFMHLTKNQFNIDFKMIDAEEVKC